MTRSERNERRRALKPWKMIGFMLIFGFIGSIINLVWVPVSMGIGFIVSFIYYNLIKGE